MNPDHHNEPDFAEDLLNAVGENETHASVAIEDPLDATESGERGPSDPRTEIERVVQNYRVVRTISETATSVVYKAEHKRTKRRVAIKVIYSVHSPNDDRINRARVEIERAKHLSHPGIAELIEAGTTDDGHCYFISDFIKGVPLDEYVSIHKLSLNDRLKLFARICEAMQYAHQRCLLHRDLRPSNIVIDGKCNPRIVGFGVAAVSDVDIGVSEDVAKKRQFGEFLAYKSPEQVSGRVYDVDVRSDLYSLGAIAYELLTDRLPYHVKSASPREFVDVISKEMPPKPSSANSALRGDLEAILLKMLDKDPNERYQTLADLMLDLNSYFDQRPINARPAGAFYEFRKLASRYRSRLISVAALALALGVFGVHVYRTTQASERQKLMGQIQTTEATAGNLAMQRDMAMQNKNMALAELATAKEAQRKAESKANSAVAQLDEWKNKAEMAMDAAKRADAQQEKAMIVSTFFPDLFQPDLAGKIVGNTAATALLDEGSRIAASYFEGEPLLQSTVFLNISRAYQNMGAIGKAAAIAKTALTTSRGEVGENHDVTIEALNQVIASLFAEDKWVDAEPYARQLKASSESVYGATHPKTLTAMHNLGMILFLQSKMDDAGEMFAQALEGRRKVLGPNDSKTATTMHYLGRVRFAQGRMSEAESLWREEIAIDMEDSSVPRWKIADVKGRLGECLTHMGRFEEAEGLLLESHADLRDLLGASHSLTKEAVSRATAMYKASGREDLASRFATSVAG